MAVFVIVIALLNQAAPLLTKSIVDLIISKIKGQPAEVSQLIFYLVLIVIANLLVNIITVISQYVGDLLSVRLNSYLSEKYYRHVLSLSIDYFDNELTGTIVNKLNRGIMSITNLVQSAVNNFLPFFVSTILTLFIIAYFSWELALVIFLLFPLYIWISHKSSVEWGKIEGQKNDIADSSLGRVQEAISSIRVVKSFIREHIEYAFFKKTRKDIIDLTVKQSIEWHKYDLYRRLILIVIMLFTFIYIIYFTFTGRFTIGQMTLLLQLSQQAQFPLFAMSFIIGQIQQAQAGSKAFFEVLEETVQIKDKPGAQELQRVKGLISYDHADFSYSKGSQVLHDVTFSIQSGNKLAIVGESGEGKSTIANLLLRFYEPQNGTILIDGVNIAEVTQESLRKNIGVVFQETFLFSGTIFDNVRYGREKATKEDVIKVAKIADAHNFISNFEKGYDTEIGERGIKLSGGQKQRIAIARALLKDPPILIFDEATSSLDSKAEFEVQRALNKLMEGRTTLIIAHRLSTIRNVDHIVVLQKGKVVEQGSPTQLEKKKGVYAELLSYQNIGPLAEKRLKEFNIAV